MNTDTARLVGGPKDGVEFPMSGKWRAYPEGLMQPAQRVLVTMLGEVHPIWPDSIEMPALGPRPPASIYQLDEDDPGWLYRYVEECP